MVAIKYLIDGAILLLEAASLFASPATPQALTRSCANHRFVEVATNSCSAERLTRKVYHVPDDEMEELEDQQRLPYTDQNANLDPYWYCDQNQDLPWPELDLNWCLANWHDGRLVPYDG
jgi:hypothetical protein